MSKELKTVRVPRAVLIRALTKARLLYIGVAAEHGHDPGPDDECWAEFEALAHYVGTTAELIAEETDGPRSPLRLQTVSCREIAELPEPWEQGAPWS